MPRVMHVDQISPAERVYTIDAQVTDQKAIRKLVLCVRKIPPAGSVDIRVQGAPTIVTVTISPSVSWAEVGAMVSGQIARWLYPDANGKSIQVGVRSNNFGPIVVDRDVYFNHRRLKDRPFFDIEPLMREARQQEESGHTAVGKPLASASL